jgi:hypothetical protein
LEGKMRVSVVATGIDVSIDDAEKVYKNDKKIVQINGLNDTVNTKIADEDEPLLFDALEMKDTEKSGSVVRASADIGSMQYDEKNELDNQAFNSKEGLDDRFDNDEGSSAVLSDENEISAPVIAKKRFGINSLIGRMTNGSGNINTEDNLDERKEPTMPGVGGDIEFDDDERIEVPAFLRRQAN